MSAPGIERQDLFNGVVQRAQRTETLVEAVMFTGLQLAQVHYGEGVVNHTGPGVFPPAENPRVGGSIPPLATILTTLIC